MKRYACDILYKYDKDEIVKLLTTAITSLGFEPHYMSVYFTDMKTSLDDISFDCDRLFNLLKGKSGTVTINHQLYDEEKGETNNWFRLKLVVNSPFGLDTCSFEWSNTNLNFLLNGNKIKDSLTTPKMIYAYCYDQDDNMNQSDEDMGDISNNWGRYVDAKGFIFMAAPLMWFGDEYFKIISKDELLKFDDASLISYSYFDLVHVKLFELYDDPEKPENRAKQESFWKSFDLQNRIEQLGNI
jgi:hypothetical protein